VERGNFPYSAGSFYDPLFDQSETHVNVFVLNFVSLGILHTDAAKRGQKLNWPFAILFGSGNFTILDGSLQSRGRTVQYTKAGQTQIIIILQHNYATGQLKREASSIP
jgi:hypothetical protein